MIFVMIVRQHTEIQRLDCEDIKYTNIITCTVNTILTFIDAILTTTAAMAHKLTRTTVVIIIIIIVITVIVIIVIIRTILYIVMITMITMVY